MNKTRKAAELHTFRGIQPMVRVWAIAAALGCVGKEICEPPFLSSRCMSDIEQARIRCTMGPNETLGFDRKRFTLHEIRTENEVPIAIIQIFDTFEWEVAVVQKGSCPAPIKTAEIRKNNPMEVTLQGAPYSITIHRVLEDQADVEIESIRPYSKPLK